jgi:hypothetical protein
MIVQLFKRFIHYEYTEWVKLHKLHIGALGIIVTIAVIAIAVLGSNTPPVTAQHPVNFNTTATTSTPSKPSPSSVAPTASTIPASVTASDKPTTNTENTGKPQSVPVANPSAPATQPTATDISTPATQPTSTDISIQPAPTGLDIGNDYPAIWASAPKDTITDTWGMYNRESVSYTAWKVNETFGNMPTTWGPPCGIAPEGGDAACWPADAQMSGIPTGTIPEVHSVGILINTHEVGPSNVGFSAWIESISGANVTYSSYNCDYLGNYCSNTVPASTFETYIYFGN